MAPCPSALGLTWDFKSKPALDLQKGASKDIIAWESRKQALASLRISVGDLPTGATGSARSSEDKQRALSKALDLCNHEDREVRHSALTLIGDLAEPGSQAALTATLGRVRDQDSRVRTTALEVLGQIALSGDVAAVEAAAKGLQDWHRPARSAALKALRRLAKEKGGCPIAAAHAIELLEDPKIEWREQVAEAIGDIAVCGDESVIELVAQRLESVRREVRAAAQEALPRLAPIGDPVLIQAVLKRLDSEHEYVRVAACQALLKVARRDDERAVEAVALRLESPHLEVRSSAGMIIAHFDPVVARPAVLARLDHSVPEVRCSTLSALSSVGRGDVTCIKAVAKQLQDPSGSVRAIAIPVLRGLTIQQEEQCSIVAVRAVKTALEHPDRQVQEAASLALFGIAQGQAEEEVSATKHRQSKMMTLRTLLKAPDDDGKVNLEEDFFGHDAMDEAGILPTIPRQEVALVSGLLDGKASDQGDDSEADETEAVIQTLFRLIEARRKDDSSTRENHEDLDSSEDEEPPCGRGKLKFKQLVQNSLLSKSGKKRRRNLKLLEVVEDSNDQDVFCLLATLSSSTIEADQRAASVRKLSTAIARIGDHRETTIGDAVHKRMQIRKALITAIEEDSSWQVRLAAVETLPHLAKDFDVDLLEVAVKSSFDFMSQVRKAAAKVIPELGRICERPKISFEALLKLLNDWSAEVIITSLEGVRQLFPVMTEDDQRGAFNSIASTLQKEEMVRNAAAHELVDFARNGFEAQVIKAVVSMIEHEDGRVKEVSRHLLERLGPSDTLLAEVSLRLDSGKFDEQTRCAALRVLSDVANYEQGASEDSQDLPALYSSTSQVASLAYANAASAVARLGLVDVAVDVRREAIRCMQTFCTSSWLVALKEVRQLLKLQDPSVDSSVIRMASLKAVIALFEASDSVSKGSKGGPAERLQKEELQALLQDVTKCLEDEDKEVRDFAAECLQSLADGGRARAIPSMNFTAKRLGHGNLGVRVAAQEALARLGGCRGERGRISRHGGNPHEAAGMAAKALGSSDAYIRQGGAAVLLTLASQGKTNFLTVAALTAHHLESEDEAVRAEASDLLCRIGGTGEPNVLEFVGAHVSSALAATRKDTLQLLVKLSPPGSLIDEASVDGGEHGGRILRRRVGQCFCDSDPEIRAAAVIAYSQLVREDDVVSVSEVASRLPRLSSAMRLSHLSALEKVWKDQLVDASGPAEVLAVTICLEDEDPEVRTAAVSLLQYAECRGDETVLVAVAKRLRHDDAAVRHAAVEALAVFADVGDRGAIAAASAHLDADSWDIRKSAVQALSRLVPHSRKATISSLLSLVSQQDEERWQRVLSALRSLLVESCEEDVNKRRFSKDGAQLLRYHTAKSLLSDDELMRETQPFIPAGLGAIPDIDALKESFAPLSAPSRRPSISQSRRGSMTMIMDRRSSTMDPLRRLSMMRRQSVGRGADTTFMLFGDDDDDDFG